MEVCYVWVDVKMELGGKRLRRGAGRLEGAMEGSSVGGWGGGSRLGWGVECGWVCGVWVVVCVLEKGGSGWVEEGVSRVTTEKR